MIIHYIIVVIFGGQNKTKFCSKTQSVFKSSHIKNLHKIKDNYYNSPEFWITSIKSKNETLYNSNINHYKQRFPFYIYEKS